MRQIALARHVPEKIKVIPHISLGALGRDCTRKPDYLIRQIQINLENENNLIKFINPYILTA
jgi:hypothetical protein